MWEVRFADKENKKFVEYRNYRGFNFTRNRSKVGGANFNLDLSPTSQTITAGWLVNIFKDGSLVYFGMVTKIQSAVNKISISCLDPIGILNRRTLYRKETVDNIEASIEVINNLNGLELLNGHVLSAGDHISKTGTSFKWVWENNKIGDYIADIGTKVDNLSGVTTPYFFWISPQLNVEFQEEGKSGHHDDLVFSNSTLSEDIINTFNNVTVEGAKLTFIPLDKDEWTEIGGDGWEVGPLDPSVLVSAVNTDKIVGALSAYQTFSSSSLPFIHHTIIAEQPQDATTFLRVNFKLILDWTAQAPNDVEFRMQDSASKYKTWTLVQNHADRGDSAPVFTGIPTWDTFHFDLSFDPDSTDGGFDPTDIIKVWINVLFDGVESHDAWLDGFYMTLTNMTFTSSDNDSIETYGRLDKHYLYRTLISRAECKIFADQLLAHYKDAKQVFNLNIDYFVNLKPNETISFEYKEIKYQKPITSITYYINIDGTESTQLVVGDYKKNSIELFADKLREINRV